VPHGPRKKRRVKGSRPTWSEQGKKKWSREAVVPEFITFHRFLITKATEWPSTVTICKTDRYLQPGRKKGGRNGKKEKRKTQRKADGGAGKKTFSGKRWGHGRGGPILVFSRIPLVREVGERLGMGTREGNGRSKDRSERRG